MKALQFLQITTLITIVLLTSCEKDDDGLPNTTINITLLNTNDWKVVAQHVQPKTQGNLGGSFATSAFSLQKQGELRWYLYFYHMTGYQDPIEIVLNQQNEATVSKPTGNTGSDFRDIKTIYGADTWETHISFNNAGNINVFKNGQSINIGYPYYGIKKLQASEDGLLNNTENYGTSNMVSHYHYSTEQWKDNSFWATQYVSTRYNDKTFVATLLNDGTAGVQGTITVLEESNTPGPYNIYAMTSRNEVIIPNAGYIMHSTRHNENLFVAINAQWQNKYVVYKINLNSYSVEKVLDVTKVNDFSNPNYPVRYLTSYTEIDPEGNLYLIENRIENQTPHYSIRKYKTNGGNEVILEETDLKEETRIEALKYFNGKLHAAIIYRQENPNNWHDNTYHMQIINYK